MSNIEIQATRSTKSNEAPQGREKYEFASTGSNTATPFYVGSMILALAMYLKSIAASSPGEGAASPKPQDENKEAVDSDTVNLSSTEAKSKPSEEPQIEGDEQDDGSPINLSPTNATATLQYFADYDPTHAQYAGPQRNAFVSSGEPVRFPVLPSNDNRADVAAVTFEGSGVSASPRVDGSEPEAADDNEDAPATSNRRPTVARPVVLYDQFACMAVMIAMNDLLRGASDPDGDRLQIHNATVSSGELILFEDGFRFHGEETGKVTITYQISDGEFEVLQTATFNVLERPPIIGSDGDDNLLGSECEDTIFGNAGNDQIDGRRGDDVIEGGAGDDHIVGGDGDDVIFGQEGNDIIIGGGGNDTLSGGEGHDRLFGDAGGDVLLGGAGDDVIWDGDGGDHVDGEAGDDSLIASADADNDLFSGGTGTDSLDYSASSTSLTFNLSTLTVSGADIGIDQFASIETFVGGQAGDSFVAAPDEVVGQVMQSDQSFDGGDGLDILDYRATQDAVTIDIMNAIATSGTIGVDRFSNIEQFVGGGGDDHFIAASTPVVPQAIEATVVTEPIEAYVVAVSQESFTGGGGIDTLDYSQSHGTVTIDTVNNTAIGETIGTDVFEEIEHFVGSNGDDNFIVGEGSVTLDGREGNDMFEFLTGTTMDVGSTTTHYIVGFDQGDWVRMSRYDIFEDAMDTLEDAFEVVYGNDLGDALVSHTQDEVIPIRIRHEVTDTIQRTYIDADFDNDTHYEISVELDGNHNLLITNSHTS